MIHLDIYGLNKKLTNKSTKQKSNTKPKTKNTIEIFKKKIKGTF